MDDLDAFGGDEDAALRHAIALSLQEAGAPSSENPIELSSDDDDGDLDKGPAYPPTPKKAAISSIKEDTKDVSATSSQSAPTQLAAAPTTGFAAFGIDRKKMEEERLARLGKRKAPDSDQDSQGRQQRLKHEANPSPAMLESSKESAAKSKPKDLPYPKGIVKKTWAAGYPKQDDQIKIEEVLQKDKLELAVVSSFQWDEEWMLDKIDIKKTKIVCIAFASNEAQQEEMKANVPKSRIRFCFPPMMPMGNMHSKLQLLRYPTYLRVVVPSGNLVPYDWGETGVMENIIFLIDLPRIEEPALRASNTLTTFGDDLSYFLRAQGLEESLVNSLKNYDFSETDRYRFVHTIGQTHMGDNWQRTGYCGLGRAVASLGIDTSTEVEVDFVVSSLGAVNMDLISVIYHAAQGDNGLAEYEKRTAKRGKKKASSEAGTNLRDKFRIYFPSRDTVVQSRGGKDAAGTICAQSKWWESPTFPRELIRDCASVRSGLLIHSKMMFVRHSHSAWGYVGSANLSESAWGRLVKDKSTSQPKLTCRNWECGVLIPISVGGHAEKTNHEDLSVFQTTIPVPMAVPGEAYGTNTSKQPWFFLEN